ncbi:ECF-type sigma factor [Novipirellula artificiosorum]|uniref:RNA polymerase sigma factor SigL n=1 Tax=Novipirellula artificiosorum TaxID=2528016 RepID=A0A5C6CWR3_9BACT|nr:ECF-type sigma factor [Novipirellula artificiosorum]TWU28992.1 RNA polymerase sigma factor SigL [Novipirellula artificiosorum]
MMPDVTQILSQIKQGDPGAAEQLLPLVYEELRKLAAAKLTREEPGQTLQATALVHEAYLRLVDVERFQNWNSRGHFFGAAAEAMRRILVENARRRQRLRHGGGRTRVDLNLAAPSSKEPDGELLALNDGLDRLASEEPVAAEVVKLRYFGGMTTHQAAEVLGISPRTANRHWAFAKAWLFKDMRAEENS